MSLLHLHKLKKLSSDSGGSRLRLGPLGAGGQGTQHPVLAGDVLDPSVRVEVLSKDKLEASGGTVSRGDNGLGQEELPDTVPSHTVLVDNLVLVAQPVPVPSPDGGRVVDTDVVDGHNFKTSGFQARGDKGQGSRSVGTRENVLVHEKTPAQVFVLPALSQTRVLQEEQTVVFKQFVNLFQKRGETTDTDVFSHFQAGDLVVLTVGLLRLGSFTVVTADNARLVRGDPVLFEQFGTPLGLVLTEGDTGNLSPVLRRGVGGPGTPATAQVQHFFTGLQVDLVSNNLELVVLQFFQSFFTVGVANDTPSINHPGAQEPGVEVVTAVVVVTHLFFVLRLRVQDDFGDHAKQEETEQRQRESEVGPVVLVFDDVEGVALERHLTVKVQFLERFNGDLGTLTVVQGFVLSLQFGGVEFQVVQDGAVGVLGLFVETGRVQRHDRPERHQDGDHQHHGEENPRLETTAKLAGDQVRDTGDETNHGQVGEVLQPGPVGGQRGVVDQRQRQRPHAALGGDRGRRLRRRRLDEFDVVQHLNGGRENLWGAKGGAI